MYNAITIMDDPGIAAAISKVGGLRRLARLLDINHQSILQWSKIPYDRLFQIEKLTGVERHVLRPDLFEGYKKIRHRKQKPLPFSAE